MSSERFTSLDRLLWMTLSHEFRIALDIAQMSQSVDFVRKKSARHFEQTSSAVGRQRGGDACRQGSE